MPGPRDADKILARIERESGVADLAGILASRLAPTDLQSLLLEVYRRRARALTPARVLDQYATSRFVAPARTDPVALGAFEALAWKVRPTGYEPVELSPVCPLGTHSAVATVDQNKIVTTLRNSEVVADPTNVLALESAVRRRALLRQDPKSAAAVKLCAVHRVIRAQRFDSPGAGSHFHLVAFSAAARDVGSRRFEAETLREQLDYILRLLASAAPGIRPRVHVTVLDDAATPVLRGDVVDRLSKAHPQAEVGFDPTRTSGRGYYRTACFKIHLLGEGGPLEVGDGGFTDWTARLLNSRKERLLIGCVAGERIVRFSEMPGGPAPS
jgi:hypothetical protein